MLHVIRLFWLVLFFGSVHCFAENSELEKQYLEMLDGAAEIEINPGMKRRMETISETYNSDEFRERITKYKNDLRGVLNMDDDNSSDDEEVKASDRPILFISASIPLNVLQKYAEQLDGIGGGTMVLKGFIGGSAKMMPTLKFIASILNVESSCKGSTCKKHNVDIIIDPVLFKHHDVERVPAFMVYESKTYIERCKGSNAIENAKIIFGDASIKGLALELASIDKRKTVERFIKQAGYDK